jgi:hypothetical protein
VGNTTVNDDFFVALIKMTETHLIIDWKNYFIYIDDYITKPLRLITKQTIKKLNNKRKTMSEFYGVNVDDFRGEIDFTLYILEDTNPIYDYRKTTKGKRKVNINIFDLKIRLRNITGGGCKIHATDNIQETKDNLKTLNLFHQYYKQKKFKSLNDVFDELNKSPELKWVVLRNFKDMPDKINIDNHLDVDVLVNDYYLIKRILDGTSATPNRYDDGKNRILNHVIIDNKNVLFDFRYLGDNYYDVDFQTKILNTRIQHKHGFYIPNDEMHLYSLIYHSIIHKPSISKTYTEIFKQYGISNSDLNKKSLKSILDTFMTKNNYKYYKPEPSVGYFI